MRVARFSDIHRHTLGLRVVLAAIKWEGGADVLCAAGDVVGGGRTTEVLDLRLDRGVRFVRGNAEDYVSDLDAVLRREPRQWRRRFLLQAWCRSPGPSATHPEAAIQYLRGVLPTARRRHAGAAPRPQARRAARAEAVSFRHRTQTCSSYRAEQKSVESGIARRVLRCRGAHDPDVDPGVNERL